MPGMVQQPAYLIPGVPSAMGNSKIVSTDASGNLAIITPGTGVASALAANVTGSGGIVLSANPTISGTVSMGGNLTFSGGNIVIGTAGQGIDFAVNSLPGSTKKILDDYEEGTWTPTISSGTGTITSYAVYSAKYTKIGRIVFITLQFAVTNNGTGASWLFVTGLPFTCAVATPGNTYNQSTGYVGSFSVNTSATDAYITDYAGGYPIATGQTLQATVFYNAT